MITETICYNDMSGHTINALCPEMAQHMHDEAGYPDYDWWDSMYDDFSENPAHYDVKVSQYWDEHEDAIKNPDSPEAKEYARLQEQAEGIVLILECTGFDCGRGREISYSIGLDQMKWYEAYAPATDDGIAKMIVEKAMADHYWHRRGLGYPTNVGDRACFYDWFGMSHEVDSYLQDILDMPSGTDDYDDVYADVDKAVIEYCAQIDMALDEYLEAVASTMLDALDKECEWLGSFECWLDGEYVVDDNICEQFGFLNEL